MASFMKNWLTPKTNRPQTPQLVQESQSQVENNENTSAGEEERLPDVEEQSLDGAEMDYHDNSLNQQDPSTSASIQVKKDKKKYKQKFRHQWTSQFPFLEERDGKAFCKVCNIKLSGGFFNLTRHSKSTFHIKNYNAMKKTPKINKSFKASEPFENSIKRAEVILAAFLTEHNLSFKLMDHLPLMVASAFPDSNIAKKLQIKRKKATQIVTNVLGPSGHKHIVSDLKESPFSIIIDETTDISLKKCLAVVVRYYKNFEIKDRFFDLIEVNEANAENLYLSIKKILDDNQIPYRNLVGLAADNASVMLGHHNSVQSLLKTNINSDMVVVGCTCHSFNLCSTHASKKIPEFIETFIHDVCNYFSKSSKRVNDLTQFQDFVQENTTKILRLCKTRWLSMEQVIQRILDHWRSLTLFFQSEFLVEGIAQAQSIFENLNNKIVKCYLLYLSFILKLINKLNLLFQSETPQLPSLLEKVTALYKTILKCFIKKTVLDKENINDIVVSNPSNFLELQNMHFGANLEVFVRENNIPENELLIFKRRALDFYIELSKQIKTRFNFNDKILRFASNFEPAKALSGNINSIAEAATFFSDLQNIDLDELNIEWQMIPEIGEQYQNCDLSAFWGNLFLQKNALNEPMFKNVTLVVKKILALPHSSAAAERIFSCLNLIKVKNRNRLLIRTIRAILHTKELIRGCACYQFEPSKDILKYNNNLTEVDVLEEDVILEII